MRNLSLENQWRSRNAARFAVWACVALLAVAMLAPHAAVAQLAGAGAISGTVTDPTGAVVGGATVTATLLNQNTSTTRTTTGAGDYNITPLTPGEYSLTVIAKGFETFVQKSVTVNALQTVGLNIRLTVGAAQQTITITSATPVLETTDASLGAVMDNQMYSSLPLLMGQGGNMDQRRATDFESLMPGVQGNYTSNNSTDNSGIINGSGPAGGVSEIYIDGINLPEADQVGDPRFTWTAFGVDSIDQFQVLTSAYSAQYGGQGVENYSVKQGTNNWHGGVYEYIRNTVLDAWRFTSKVPTVIATIPQGGVCAYGSTTANLSSFCAMGGVKPTEIQNEVGATFGGPIIKNKLFMFYNYGQYRNQNGPTKSAITLPTLNMIGYTGANGSLGTYADYTDYHTQTGYSIFDPATQIYNCAGTVASPCSRLPFVNGTTANQIPATRFSAAAKWVNQFLLPYEALAVQTGPTAYSNNILAGEPYGLANWYQGGRLDYNMNSKNQLSLIIAFGRQASTGNNSVGNGQLGPPFNTSQSYTPKTNIDILEDTWTITPHLVNMAAVAYGRYKSLSVTPDEASIYSATNSGLIAAGNTALPPGQDSYFPEILFSGGFASPGQQGGYDENQKVNNTYTATDNVQWQVGKHTLTFGGQVVEVQFNYIKDETPTSPLSYTFSANQTAAFVDNEADGTYSAAYGTGTGASQSLASSVGASVASYMIGAVNTSSITLDLPGFGTRWLDPSFWVQDDFKVDPKLTLNLGLRWDIWPSIHEVHDLFTWLDTTGINSVTGNMGTLAFAGGNPSDGYHTGVHNPSPVYYGNFAPRVGAAYSINNKTVIRASYGLDFARGDWTSGSQSGTPSSTGLAPGATAAAAVSSQPQFYWDNTACTNGNADSITCGWTGSVVPPASSLPAGAASLAEFATTETSVTKTGGGSTLSYWDPHDGARTPEYINWTFGFQRQLTNNMSITVSYVGSEGHFISVSKAVGKRNNENPESLAGLAAYNSTNGACSGTSCTASLLTSVATAANLGYASGDGFAVPNPFAAGTTYYASNDVYQYYFPFPQFSGVSDTTSFVGNENWNALEISVRQRPAHGLNFMLNYTYSKAIDDLGTFRVGDNDRLDRSLSTTDEPQNLVGTVVYQLPIGRGHWGGDNLAYRAIASDWSVSDIFTYHSGYPVVITAGGCGGAGILNQCQPSIVPGVAARQHPYGKNITAAPGSPNYYATIQYLNPAAFTVNTNSSSATGEAINVGAGPALYVPGNAPRVAPLNTWGMGWYDDDISVKRTFPIYREWNVGFELDMINMTNHTVWASPGGSVATGVNSTTGVENASFGEISGLNSAYTPRDVQGSLRINW